MADATFTVVLIPGLACDGAVWADQIASLERRGHRTSVVDHGTADSLVIMAAQVLASVRGDLVVVGHSMGGRVALEMARLAAHRLRGLALLDTGYRSLNPGPAGRMESDSRSGLVTKAEIHGMRVMAAEWVQNLVHADRLTDAPLIDSILNMFERSTVERFRGQQCALLARPDATALLPQIACPTMLLCGEQDAWSPWIQHQEMAALIPASSLVGVPDCGHMAPMERPEAVSHALVEWLEEVRIRH